MRQVIVVATTAIALVVSVLGAAPSFGQAAPASAPASAAASDDTPPTPERLAEGVWLVPGGIRPHRQPDGNTVVFLGRRGAVVFDTGRHAWQQQAIEGLLDREHRPAVAIVNSHWHLDHVGGNIPLRRRWPDAQVYATDALDRALSVFFPDSVAGGRAYLETPDADPLTAADVRHDLGVIDAIDRVKPTVVVRESRSLAIDGLHLRLNLAPDAATDGDLWLYDPASRTVAAGDLITLPAPFLDTACVDGWRHGLDAVAAVPFARVIPGHGPVMDRTAFETYRRAFVAFTDCARGTDAPRVCGTNWARDVAGFLAPGEAAAGQAAGMAAYYVRDVLRANGGDSRSCRTRHAG